MTTTISGDTGIDKVQDGSIGQTALGPNVVGTGPCFSAVASATQGVANTIDTKLAFNVKQFDTNNCFNTTTYRFTPNVAGYYFITAQSQAKDWASASGYMRTSLVTQTGQVMDAVIPPVTVYVESSVSCLIYFNGTTDYVEAYTQHSTTGTRNISGQIFQGFLVRAA